MKKRYSPTNRGIILGWIVATTLLGVAAPPTAFGADRIVLAEHFTHTG